MSETDNFQNRQNLTTGEAAELPGRAVTDWTAGLERRREKYARAKLRADADFSSISGVEPQPLYTPLDVDPAARFDDLGFPGEFPYTRGIHPTMYRGRLWTMRQFAGFGTPKETNERFHYLLKEGQTGLSIAFDFPTLMGYDSDHPRSKGEVGRCGVAVDTVEDLETIFDDIPLDRVSTSMTINGPAAMLFAFYLAVAHRRGIPFGKLRGTIQNDILKEYHAQNSWLVGPEPSLRIITDILAYASEHVPQWNTVSISGYHIREAGSTAGQELGFTLADGLCYVDEGLKAGLELDKFAPRLSFFFDAHIDFFEEIAKFRAARRIWAREMKKRGARNPKSLMLRFHTQTAGVSLTAQQPENNIVRTTIEALAGVLGGTQSLHTNSFDEALALPSDRAVRIALRTQQIIADESGAADVADPLGGAWYVEALTDRLEHEAYDIFTKIEKLGGMLAAVDSGYFRREITRSSLSFQRAVDSGRRAVVGVNRYADRGGESEVPLHVVDPACEEEQKKRLAAVKSQRDPAAVEAALRELEEACRAPRGEKNIMEALVACALCSASLGEMCEVVRKVYGEYRKLAAV